MDAEFVKVVNEIKVPLETSIQVDILVVQLNHHDLCHDKINVAARYVDNEGSNEGTEDGSKI